MVDAIDPTLERCPLCGREPADVGWYGEQGFLVDCTWCTQYTITSPLAEYFAGALTLPDRQLVRRLSRYLHEAGDDDDRELTAESWRRLAVGG